jgi:hypothetical protein
MRNHIHWPMGHTFRSVRRTRFAGAGALALAALLAQPGCTSQQRDSQSPSYLVLANLEAASGATPQEFGNVLSSDVLTRVKQTIDGEEVRVPTIFADGATASFILALRDPGTDSSPTTPSPANFITVTRYHVKFVRSDGRNVQGVDVPYEFDGAATGTVTAAGGGVGITLVRNQSKAEAPLASLVNGGGAGYISTIAEVTFYGTDQAGREVSVTGKISVNFADWGDPD